MKEVEEEAVALKLDQIAKNTDRDKFKQELMSDESVKSLRELGDRKEQGYTWKRGILVKIVVDEIMGTRELLVVPKPRRYNVLRLAHDKMGHTGYRKVVKWLRKKFTWPYLVSDTMDYCKSCDKCQKVNKSGVRKAPIQKHPILTHPFESIAVDLVGPLPTVKGVYRYILTSICLASKWPYAIPLKSITAEAVAEGLINIFARTGLPMSILTDQGSHFNSRLHKELCNMLVIRHLTTSAYHPQTNGCVERMHYILESMLAKASSQEISWVPQLPFALFALRQMPNRETGCSLHDLVLGCQVRSPLDLVYIGWKDEAYGIMNLTECNEKLQDKLEVTRETMAEKANRAVKSRKNYYDRNSIERKIAVGDLVLYRIPGMDCKLADAWKGHYVVLEKFSLINYGVRDNEKRGKGFVVHINAINKYEEREAGVRRLTIIADKVKEERCMKPEKSLEYREGDIKELEKEFSDVLTEEPGYTNIVKMTIDVCGAVPIEQRPYRVPDKLKDKDAKEIQKLKDAKIIEESDSTWASPMIPVVKPNGDIRVCVDFRRVNQVTRQDHFYIPTLHDILEKVGHSSVISTLDMTKGFHEVEVD